MLSPIDVWTSLLGQGGELTEAYWEAHAQRMREAHEMIDEQKDVATASLLETFIDEAERRAWFLYEASHIPPSAT